MSVSSLIQGSALVTEVGRYHPVEVRAQSLKEQIDSYMATYNFTERLNLIAHSLGGLDARYYITHLEGHKRVSSLITLSSPHRGSALADWALSFPGGEKAFELARANLPFEIVWLCLTSGGSCKHNPKVCQRKVQSVHARPPRCQVPSHFSHLGITHWVPMQQACPNFTSSGLITR